MADPYDLHLEQGVSFVRRFIWRAADGTRQSLAGWRAAAQIRQDPSGRLLLDLAPYLTVVHDAPAGAGDTGDAGDALELNIPGDITRTVDAPGVWDLRLVDAAGGEHVRAVVLLRGKVTHDKAVTVA